MSTSQANHAPAERCAGGHASVGGTHGSKVTDKESEHQTGEPDGKPLSWLARDQGPPERHALREIAGLGDPIVVDGQTYLVVPVSGPTRWPGLRPKPRTGKMTRPKLRETTSSPS